MLEMRREPRPGFARCYRHSAWPERTILRMRTPGTAHPGIPSRIHDCGQTLRCAVAARIRNFTSCLLLCIAGCASTPQRAAPSAVGCAEAVLATLPAGLTDPEKHCVASAGIAMHCSRFEAWLAGYGKEIRDAFGDGDASWADLHADRIGRRCAATQDRPDALIECCRQALPDSGG